MKNTIRLISGAVLFLAFGCCFSACNDHASATAHNDTDACGSCGKNSCDKSCASNPANDSTKLKSQVPSCNLSEPELQKRKAELQNGIFSKVKSVEELETGYQFTFVEPTEFSNDLLAFVNFERGCCSSFSYALVFEPNNKAMHLQMYGSKEIKEELKNGFMELGILK